MIMGYSKSMKLAVIDTNTAEKNMIPKAINLIALK